MSPSEPVKPVARASLLAQLNAHIEQVSGQARPAPGAQAASWPELRSVVCFRPTWERLRAEGQVQRSRRRVPSNAGPLNPQRLMMDALARMGELSPHYLQRFLAHAETLIWLEHAHEQLKRQQPLAPIRGKTVAGRSVAKASRSKR